MEYVIVQNHHKDMIDVLSTRLDGTTTLLSVDDSELPGVLNEHKGKALAVVLFELTDSATRFCELVRNGRFCHPWTPIALIDSDDTVAGPVGSVRFTSTEDESLIAYLSEPVSKSILVIEDDKNIRQYLSLCLGDTYLVDTASNAIEGEKMYQENHYDLLILDVMLPGMNGDELTAKIRETDTTTPILVVTAYDTSAREADFNKIGATDYMRKPFKGNDSVRSTVMGVLATEHLKSFKLNGAKSSLSTEDAWKLYSSRVSRYISD